MKRYLTVAFAAVLLAAWAVPAMAIDFGGQYRARGEWRDNVNFEDNNGASSCAATGDPASTVCDDRDSAYVNQRVRLWGVANPTDDTTVKITIQDTRQWGEVDTRGNGGPRLTDDTSGIVDADDEWSHANANPNHLDLHESWVQVDDVFGLPVAVKIGRQELNYGDQRLVGSFGWSEYGRSFDALKLMYNSDIIDVDAFWAKISDGSAAGFTATGADSNDVDQDFYGLYGTVKAIPNNTLDLYLLWLRDGTDTQIIANNNGDLGTVNETQNLATFGARLKGNFQIVDYTIEGALQDGTINTAVTAGNPTGADYDLQAYMLAIKAGVALPVPQKVRLGFEYNLASGDSDNTDTDLDTFSQLFPTNHGAMGFQDQHGLRNIEAIGLNVSGKPMDKLKLYAAWWFFELAEQEDAWYGAGNWMDAPGGVRAANPTNTEAGTGSEIDLVATYKYNDAVTLQAGYSHYFVDDFVEMAHGGNEADQDWAYLQMTANF